MKVYRIAKCQFIDDISGFGSYLYGGRWNSKGVHMLYTSSTSSLAMLEMIAHGIEIQEDYCMLMLEIPDDKIKTINQSELPANWFAHPAPDQLKSIGDAFVADNKYLAIRLPSAVNRSETNVLINPKHVEFKKVKVIVGEKIMFARFG